MSGVTTNGVADAVARKEPLDKNISVIGAGRLGLCWALAVERAGYHVKAVDIFPTYVDAINERTLRSSEPQVMEMLSQAKNLSATLSIAEAVAFSRFIYIFVQTPSTGSDRHYDHTHLSDVLTQLSALQAKDKHVFICCTVMPGYCDTIAPSLLSGCENVSVSYSPEFIAQGAIMAGILSPDMVLIGEGSVAAGNHIEELTLRYVSNCPPVHRMSAGSAEVAKLALNAFITLKIAFGNFVGDLADAAERARKRSAPDGAARSDKRKCIDKMHIAKAIGADSRVGLKCLVPGYGFGGPCFPRDGRALASFARSVAHTTCPVDATLAEAPERANLSHACFQAQQLVAAADAALATGAAGATVLHSGFEELGLVQYPSRSHELYCSPLTHACECGSRRSSSMTSPSSLDARCRLCSRAKSSLSRGWFASRPTTRSPSAPSART